MSKNIFTHAKDLLSILDQASKIKERVTALKLIEAWMRTGQPKLRVAGMKPSPLSKGNCEKVVVQLMLDQVLKEDFHFTPYTTLCYLLKGPRKNLLLEKNMVVTMDFEEQMPGETNVCMLEDPCLGKNISRRTTFFEDVYARIFANFSRENVEKINKIAVLISKVIN